MESITYLLRLLAHPSFHTNLFHSFTVSLLSTTENQRALRQKDCGNSFIIHEAKENGVKIHIWNKKLRLHLSLRVGPPLMSSNPRN
mmetsp:Transcript_5081/g.10316  ORF Transcript_5081/g.10316 Transcript_5081/m.10316 type:complete len:86 (-) Transcript_5081:492-749(-)